jgi:hypothetical protein
MQPSDHEAAEQVHWASFVQQLGNHLAAQWPAMPERLGERYAAFIEAAVQQADKRGFVRAAAVARYVNLWFVWGPAFHDKPGFEWALGLLAAPRQGEVADWRCVHQLVRRSMAELQRLPDALIDAAALAHADERLIDAFGMLGRRGELHPAEPAPLPRHACDLEACELRLLSPAVSERYALLGGQWQREPLPLPPPLRISAADPAPRLIGVLSHAPGLAAPARLQLRSRSHAVCDGDVHPALDFAGTHGLWSWQGHETRALSWPVAALAQPLPPAGAGSALAEETSPDIFRLELLVCGLRDEGDALGSLRTQLWVWPAAQWWLELQRAPTAPQPVLAGQAAAVRGSTRVRLECDGQAQDTAALRQGFEQGLDPAAEDALQRWLATWARVPGLSAPRLEGVLALLAGRAAVTWGWQLGARGMDGRAFMRVQGELALQACQAELVFEGELAFAGARARLVLRCTGTAALVQSLRRETAEPPLLPSLMPAQTAFELPLLAEITPIASDSGALLTAGGPCKAVLAGASGLRPRTSGGSGWEWFATLRLGAATLPLRVVDPVLGEATQTLALWPEQTLLDWRLA